MIRQTSHGTRNPRRHSDDKRNLICPYRPTCRHPDPGSAPLGYLWRLLFMLAIYFVGAEEGATSLIKGKYVHEFVHDGRHLLGFPCH